MEKEKKETMMMMGGVKVEDAGEGPYSYSGFINDNNDPLISSSRSSSSVFDFNEKSRCLGFMELLGVQEDYYSAITSNIPLIKQIDSPHHQACADATASHNNNKDPFKTGKEYCPDEVPNQQMQQPPATPNSSSISSASSDAIHHEQTETTVHQQTPDDHDNEHYKTDKQLKVKKTNQKRQREPRFAFMTKSEVDHLEDGYRWRKYGQKAVKNSPFPRSYYRCTTTSCNVKKRVERSLNDPTIVVTTYEGQHTHPSPVMARSSSGFSGSPIPPGVAAAAATGALGSVMPENYLSQYYHHQRQQQQQLIFNTLSSLGFPHPSKFNNNNGSISQERQHCNPGITTNAFLPDHGLLQDVVPSHMLKEE